MPGLAPTVVILAVVVVLVQLLIAVGRRTGQRNLAVERQANAQALASPQLTSEFLARMSHEIRTPMNGVIGLTEALIDTDLDETQLEYVRMIRSSGDALLGVINDILDLSKIEAGRLPVERTELDIAALVDEVCVLFASSARAKGLHLEVAIEPALDRPVYGDPRRIRQVLTNLVADAVTFTEHGRIQVSVAEDGEHVRFEVRTPATVSQADAGAGLGLALSKRLAEAMGGATGLVRESGKGTTFWFTVALHPEVPASACAPSMREPSGSTPPRVLVAEDNHINQVVAVAMLRKLGCSAAVAQNGREAVEMCTHEDFAAVLMDCQMPQLDGYDATREIRKRECGGHRIPIIAVTAQSRTTDRDDCLEAGMDDYVSKPLRSGELAAALGRWLPVMSHRSAGPQG